MITKKKSNNRKNPAVYYFREKNVISFPTAKIKTSLFSFKVLGKLIVEGKL